MNLKNGIKIKAYRYSPQAAKDDKELYYCAKYITAIASLDVFFLHSFTLSPFFLIVSVSQTSNILTEKSLYAPFFDTSFSIFVGFS